ncbi:MAG: leucyl/phenylalanyl-tRNA--protein transferase [Spirochaetes bacterium]|jgi:leucyl/phenylalanyl-tRNA--protein transferase|nr:leucyl/phenylalanyl-tRNA--protein transferase [Spirochaetota bacterium]
MPVFELNDDIKFPPVELADQSGILAVGGDLSPERLIEAYRNGIFPWYSDGDPIIWWSPDPRFVLFPDELRVSRSMKQVLSRNTFSITFDRAFSEVIEGCRKPRKKQRGTWITDEMSGAYRVLHGLGYAHSVEAWRDGKLAGGLYGISLGKCFFGESMFTRESNASKAAFITLAGRLREMGFIMIDCQVHTGHLESLGAAEISRSDFMAIVRRGLEYETLTGNWGRFLG